MQKINELCNKNPTKTQKDVIKTFWHEDWDTLTVSGIVLFLNIVVHFIMHTYAEHIIIQNQNYHLWSFGIALTLGYAGQRLIYKYLGSAEKFLDSKSNIDKLKP
jgi:hypothetical protein